MRSAIDIRAWGWSFAFPAAAAVAGFVLAEKPHAAVAATVGATLAAAALAAPGLAPPLVVAGLAVPTTGWGAALGNERTRLFALTALATLALVAAAARAGTPSRKARVWPILVLMMLLLIVEAATSSSRPVAQRTVEVALALLVGGIVYLGRRVNDRVAAGGLRAILAILTFEACLAIAQLASARPLGMSSALDAASRYEATNISGYFRGIGTFYHPNSLALTLVLTLPLALSRARVNRGPRLPTSQLIPIVLTAGVVASLSRAGLVALAVAGLSSVIIARAWRDVVRLAVIIGVCIAVVLTVPVMHRAAERFTSSSAAVRDQGSNQARAANAGAALKLFELHPVTGIGLGAGAIEGSAYGGYSNMGAHNAYLDILEGGGILLALLVAGAVLAVRRDALMSWRSGDPLVLLVPLVAVYSLWESLFQGLPLVMIAIGGALMHANAEAAA